MGPLPTPELVDYLRRDLIDSGHISLVLTQPPGLLLLGSHHDGLLSPFPTRAQVALTWGPSQAHVDAQNKNSFTGWINN